MVRTAQQYVTIHPNHRCPACGQPVGFEHPAACPLCGSDLGDPRATGPDGTLYAKARESRSPGWCAMLVWVWLAGTERLKHLALMRASSASRRFARINGLLLSLSLGAFVGALMGWHHDSRTILPGDNLPVNPAGRYWFQAAGAPLSSSFSGTIGTSCLWWNPVRASFAAIVGAVLAGVLFWMTLRLMRLGATLAHRQPYRDEQRMTAAIHYGTAWVLLGIAGACVAVLLPPASCGRSVGWGWCPPGIVVRLVAGVLGGLGVVLWWFWLVRLASTAPAKTRARVVLFFSGVMPVIGVALGGLWWVILRYYLPMVFQSWRLDF